MATHAKQTLLSSMEEPGEQCTVVFALILTELASGREGGRVSSPAPPPPHTHSLAGSVKIIAKTIVHCFPSFHA